MSLFSSLNYLLVKATSAIHQNTSTELPLDATLEQRQPSITPFFTGESESSTINTTSYNNYQHDRIGPGKYLSETTTNNSFNSSTKENWLSFISLTTAISKTYFDKDDSYTSESDVQFTNETYPDAEHLIESWWNIFDTRYLRHGWVWTTALIIAYMLILVVGVIGNVMVILVVSLRPQMRSVTNMFIMNLAVADLFVILFCVPSTLLANIIAPWILGTFMCKAVAYVQGVSVCASAYSLAAISFDRCQAVYRNYERPRGFSQRICVRTVFIIWAVAISLTVPWAVIFEVKVSEYDGLRYCVETWQEEKYGNIYFLVVNLTCFYAIPLILIFVSNWIIYCHVTHRKVPEDSTESSAPIRKMHRQTRHDVLKMLGIVTLTFLFSWLPLYILVIRIKFAANISESEYNVLGILMPIAQWLGSWNSSVNPILYAFLNKKFRRMFKSILPSWFPIKSAGQDVGSHSYTTAFTGKRHWRSGASSRNDFHRHHQNGYRNSHGQTNLLISRFHEHSGTVATTAVQISSSSESASPVLSNQIPGSIFEMAIGERAKTSNRTDL